MIRELDLTDSQNQPKDIHDFIYSERDRMGGCVIALIIPPNLAGLMYNVKLNMEGIPQEFYFYGWYNVFHFEIYVDTMMSADVMYLVCNMKSMKVKVKNWMTT